MAIKINTYHSDPPNVIKPKDFKPVTLYADKDYPDRNFAIRTGDHVININTSSGTIWVNSLDHQVGQWIESPNGTKITIVAVCT